MDKNQGYEIIKAVMLENGRGFALGHHPTAPSPYVTPRYNFWYLYLWSICGTDSCNFCCYLCCR